MNKKHKEFLDLYKLSARTSEDVVSIYKKIYKEKKNDDTCRVNGYRIIRTGSAKKYIEDFDDKFNAKRKEVEENTINEILTQKSKDFKIKILSREKALSNLSSIAQIYMNKIAENNKKNIIVDSNVMMLDKVLNTISKIDGWYKTNINATIEGVSEIVIKRKNSDS